MVRESYLGEIDKKILDLLKNNAKIKYTKIAELLNISETGVRKIIKKLEKEGIIQKYTIEIDYKKLGLNVSLIGLDVEANKLLSVIEKLKEVKNVNKIYVTSGDHDIIVEFIYKDQEELNNFVKTMEKTEGVIRVCPAIIVNEIKF